METFVNAQKKTRLESRSDTYRETTALVGRDAQIDGPVPGERETLDRPSQQRRERRRKEVAP